MEKLVYIVLVNYNGWKDTLECIKSLEDIEYKNYKIVIVDNCSQDDSYTRLRESIKQDIKLIASDKNLGFAGGNNLGITYALSKEAEYVLLLNNDTLVEKDFLKEIIDTAERNSAGIVGSKIKYESKRDTLWFAGGEVLWNKFYAIHYGEGEKDQGQYEEEREVSFITGCSMLISKKVFEEIGLLSEEYFMYFEDVDFCVRASGKGFKIVYSPKSVIYHKIGAAAGGEESPFAVKWNTRNRILFMNKYKNKVGNWSYRRAVAFFYSTRILKYIQYICSKRKDKAICLKEGIKSGRKMLPKT